MGDTNKRVYILATFPGVHSNTGKSHTLVMPKGGDAGYTWHSTCQLGVLVSAITRISIPGHQALCWLDGSAHSVQEVILLSDLGWGGCGSSVTLNLVKGVDKLNAP